MIVRMKADASREEIDYVLQRVGSLGLVAHLTEHGGQATIGLTGDLDVLQPAALEGLRGVDRVQSLSQPFRLASLEFRSEPTVITVGDVPIGGVDVIAIAGPCSVENRDQVRRTAASVRESGARLLRGGAFKPRSSPYSFQGLAEEGLEILAQAREETGLGIVTEVMSTEQVPLVCQYADVLQIGTRNMQNFNLLRACGKIDKPVLLKRGMMSTINELLLSAEYILAQGNPNVILCERGIRTFETYTRNTLDINAVPAMRELTHLPIVVDPSHATGRRTLVKAVSAAAVAAGADGLMIEVHPDPARAWSDGQQSLNLPEFRELVETCRAVAAAVGRKL